MLSKFHQLSTSSWPETALKCLNGHHCSSYSTAIGWFQTNRFSWTTGHSFRIQMNQWNLIISFIGMSTGHLLFSSFVSLLLQLSAWKKSLKNISSNGVLPWAPKTSKWLKVCRNSSILLDSKNLTSYVKNRRTCRKTLALFITTLTRLKSWGPQRFQKKLSKDQHGIKFCQTIDMLMLSNILVPTSLREKSWSKMATLVSTNIL